MAERQRSRAQPVLLCVCWTLPSLNLLTPGWGSGGLIVDLCVGEVRPVRYLRGDTGAPAHALLAAP